MIKTKYKHGDKVLARCQSIDVVGTIESVSIEPAQVYYSIRARDGMYVTVHEDYVKEAKSAKERQAPGLR